MISSKATVGTGTVFGEYCVVEDGAVIGSGCVIGSHVVIHGGSRIGDGVRVDDFACIGKLPMKAAASAVTKEQELSPAEISDGCIVGTGAVIYAGCRIGCNCLIADLATVRENVEIGEKTILGRGAAVENRCKIGSYCKIETNAYICAYSEIGDHCFIAPCVVTSNDNFAGRTKKRFSLYGGVRLKNGGRLGAGAVILPAKTIGEDGFVAAGSVVTKDVPPETVMAGNPAKELRKVPEEQLLKNNL